MLTVVIKVHLGLILLEGTWPLVSLWGTMRVLRRARPGEAHQAYLRPPRG
jgi:hypothetical protein